MQIQQRQKKVKTEWLLLQCGSKCWVTFTSGAAACLCKGQNTRLNAGGREERGRGFTDQQQAPPLSLPSVLSRSTPEDWDHMTGWSFWNRLPMNGEACCHGGAGSACACAVPPMSDSRGSSLILWTCVFCRRKGEGYYTQSGGWCNRQECDHNGDSKGKLGGVKRGGSSWLSSERGKMIFWHVGNGQRGNRRLRGFPGSASCSTVCETVKRDHVAFVDFIQFYRRGREGSFPISVLLVSPN